MEMLMEVIGVIIIAFLLIRFFGGIVRDLLFPPTVYRVKLVDPGSRDVYYVSEYDGIGGTFDYSSDSGVALIFDDLQKAQAVVAALSDYDARVQRKKGSSIWRDL